MKFIRLGPSKKNICIGDDMRKGEWYSISDAVRDTVLGGTLNPGDDVIIKYDTRNNQKILLEISKGTGNSGVATSSSTASPEKKSSWTPKTPEEQNSIKRQAIGHMVSRSLIGLQGQITEENIEPLMTRLYAKYQELVG